MKTWKKALPMTNESDSIHVHGKLRFGFAGVLVRLFRHCLFPSGSPALEQADCGGTGVPDRFRNIRRTGSTPLHSLTLLRKGFAVLVIALTACAQHAVVAPSTAPLQSDLGHAQQHIGEAKTLAQRIHDKDVIIDMWRKQHGEQ